MRRWIAAGALLFGCLSGCARPGVFGAPDAYNHTSQDSVENPFQANFPAPHGGYLFPFRDLVLEVVLERKGAAVVFLYDEMGNPVASEAYGRRAGLTVETPGFSDSFTIGLYRYGENAFAGRFPITETLAIQRAPALRFRFAVSDARGNYIKQQCHNGHWSVAAGGKFYGESAPDTLP